MTLPRQLDRAQLDLAGSMSTCGDDLSRHGGYVRRGARVDKKLRYRHCRAFRSPFESELFPEIVDRVFMDSGGVIMTLDYCLITSADPWIEIPLFLVLLLALICYALTSVFLFPVMVNYEGNWHSVIKNSFLIAVSRLGISLLCLVLVLFVLAVTLYLPAVIRLAGSSTAYLLYLLCGRAFHHIEVIKSIVTQQTEQVQL